MFSKDLGLGLAGAAQDVDQLVADQLLDVGTGGRQVVTGIELVGMLSKELTDSAGHCQSQVGVNVDLADCQLSSAAQLLLGNTDSAGHCTAVGVDHLDVLLGNGGGAVQNDGEAGQLGDDLLQDVEAQLGVGAGLELVSAVGGADGDGQGVTAGTGDELLDLLGTGVVSVVSETLTSSSTPARAPSSASTTTPRS